MKIINVMVLTVFIMVGVVHMTPSVNAQIESTIYTEVSTDLGSTSAVTNTSADVSVDASSDVSVEVMPIIATVTTSVDTSASVKAYVESVEESDKNIDDVKSTSDHVSVSYKQPAKLFGFISMDMSVKGSVDTKGNVRVNYPWYSFLTNYKSDTKLESDINIAVSSIVDTEGETEFSGSLQTQLITAIHTVMKAHSEANVDSEADASMEADVMNSGEVEAN